MIIKYYNPSVLSYIIFEYNTIFSLYITHHGIQGGRISSPMLENMHNMSQKYNYSANESLEDLNE